MLPQEDFNRLTYQNSFLDYLLFYKRLTGLNIIHVGRLEQFLHSITDKADNEFLDMIQEFVSAGVKYDCYTKIQANLRRIPKAKANQTCAHCHQSIITTLSLAYYSAVM